MNAQYIKLSEEQKIAQFAMWREFIHNVRVGIFGGKVGIDRCECTHSLLDNCTDECNCRAHNYASRLMALRDSLNEGDIRLA